MMHGHEKWIAPLALVLALGWSAGLAVANDDCADAIAIGQGDTNFDTTGATTDGVDHPGSDCEYAGDSSVNQDIWYSFTSDCTGEVSVSTCDLTDWDTRIAVYQGCDCPLGDADLLICNDDGDPEGCGLQSHLSFEAIEGNCYMIRIGGYEDSEGPGVVNIDCDIPQEACLNATEGCFEEHDEPGCNQPVCCETVCDADDYCCEVEWDSNCRDMALDMCGGLGACCNAQGVCEESVPEAECDGQWYQEETCENVNCVNTACVDADGGCWGIEPNTTPGCSDSTCCDIVCDLDGFCCDLEWDDNCDDLAWANCGGPTNYGACCVEGDCTGTVLEAECNGFWFQGQNCSMINCEFAALDFCQSASEITEGSHAVDTSNATTDGPAHEVCTGDDIIDNDVWFQFTPDVSGDLLVDTCGSEFDTMLAIYEGCDCPVNDARLLVCADDEGDCGTQTVTSAPVEADTCYLIRMGGYGETSQGAGTINIDMDIFPEVCGTATGECFFEHAEPGCNMPDCCDMVCDEDMYCCDVEWDTNCRDMALTMCGGLGGCCNAEGVCEDSIPEAECDGEWFQETSCEDINCTNAACIEADGDCWGIEPNTTPGCSDSTCCDIVCDVDDYCCNVEWDSNCADLAWANCGGPTEYGACCVEGDCTGTVMEAECNGIWFQGQNCAMVNCQFAELDFCQSASEITDGSHAIDTSDATTDGPAHEACTDPGDNVIDNDVWFQFTPDVTGDLLVDTCGSEFDTMLAVYEGCDCPVNDARLLVCGDDEGDCGTQTAVTAEGVQADTCYLIRVGGYSETSQGAGTLNIEMDIFPEACIDGDGDCWGIDPNTTPGCDTPECCDLVCNEDMFCCDVEWDENCVDIAWAVCGNPTGRGACCFDEGGCGITTGSECDGTWYEGILCETIDNCESPIADFCPGTPIEPGEIAVGFTTGATEDEGLPYCGTSIDSPGVWYSLEGTGHSFIATTCNEATDYDTKMNVFCASCGDAVCVGGDDDSDEGMVDRDCVVPETGVEDNRASSVRWCSELGGEYYILVQGYNGAVGNFGLEIIDEGACDDPAPGCVPPVGACCEGLTCVGDTAPQDCNGAWYGGQTCDDFVCPAGACCDGDTCIGTMPESECNYSWFMGEDCATFDCPSCEYCDICYTDLDDDWITNVTFGDINRTSDAETGDCSYADATALSTAVEPGQSYPISVSFYSGTYEECVKVYIDWNQDCTFSEDEGTEVACGTDTTVTGTIAVPADAAGGCTTMRVIEEYNGMPEDACNDVGTSYGAAEDYTVCVGSDDGDLIDSTPPADGSLWRNANNYVMLEFNVGINPPASGDVMIQELLDGGAYGPDLAANFSFEVDGMTMAVIENGSVLSHGTWYAIRSMGTWGNIRPFEVPLVLVVGDATGEGMVLPNDLSLINTDIPNFNAPVDSRLDVTGEGMVLPNDLSVTNVHIPTFAVSKPTGH